MSKLNEKMSECLNEHMEDILSEWLVEMKQVKGENFFKYLPEQQIEKTSREFGDLMVTNLTISQSDKKDITVDSHQLKEFTERVVRFGWSVKFVNVAIEIFVETAFKLLEEKEILHQSNYRKSISIINNWASKLRISIIDAYTNEWERTVLLQKTALQELSASLIPVFDKISVMPLVGTIDTERAKLIMENLLQGIVKQRAEVVLLDITDVPIVDTMVAHHIIQATEAVRLIGAKCMLVGIRPEIAQTIVALGIDLKDFTTTSNLQLGVKEALKLTNRKIVGVEK